MALIAGLVALVVVAASVSGYFLLRAGGPWGASASETTVPTTVRSAAHSSTATSAASSGAGAAGMAPATTRSGSPATNGQSGSGTATGPTAFGSSSASAGLATTAYQPTPTKATSDCAAPSGVDAAGVAQTYGPEKAIDGKKETAWRCNGDATGRILTIDFGGPVQLTSVGLIAGFDKVDPTDGSDRFAQGRKIVRVRWTFDDGTSVESAPNGERSAPATPVAVRTSTVRMTILETRTGSSVTNTAGATLDAVDISAISEVTFSALR